MATQPIGVTFIPSAEQAAQGPQRGQLEGDLGQAFKILSLRLPRVLGARAVAPTQLLNGPGSAGAPPGTNPYAAVFDALLRSRRNSGGSSASAPMANVPAPNWQVLNPPPAPSPFSVSQTPPPPPTAQMGQPPMNSGRRIMEDKYAWQDASNQPPGGY